MAKYNPSEIEPKWQKIWEEKGVYKPDLDKAKKSFYNLMMFPYPSAEGMHVGNMYAFTGSDIYGRFKRMQGYDVFEPIGLDGFGIHSENYAIKVGRHPKEQAVISQKNFYRQLRQIGNGFDWSRTVETYDPQYYKWTQWIFIQLFKAGLAYRKKAPVNFCPSCKTVLADEQVIDGKCERCSTVVEKRDLEQWFFKITAYADALLDSLSKIDWSEKVKIAQREWIGRKEGTSIRFTIDDLRFKNQEIEVFTTRGDTLYGATFLVIAPEHPVSTSIKDKKVQEYIKQAKKKTDQERIAQEKDKTGVFSGLYAINPLNKEKLPVWIADYALMGFGTGALFGDAHDERDVVFAKKYGIPLKVTLITGDKERDARILSFKECFTEDGTLIDSGEFSGLSSKEAREKVAQWLSKRGRGGRKTTYHLRDWLISRQRYWGPPIPMIYCDKCGWQPVPEEDLPVLLPDVEDWRPEGTGTAPLANHPEFYNTTCPKCGVKAKRETDVSDTFLDSSWYFFRYISTEEHNKPWREDRVKKWLPVNMYIGGAEHSVLHLLYTRFLTKVFKDLKLISFDEPFPRFFAHGLMIKKGAKMSKSKGNVVVPDEYIKKYGADALRTYLMFSGPFFQGGDFHDGGIEGMFRFLKRVWNLVLSSKYQVSREENLDKIMHKTIKKVTDDLASLHYNTAIAALMEYYNEISNLNPPAGGQISKRHIETLLLLLAPFAPHMSEELYQRFTIYDLRFTNKEKNLKSYLLNHKSFHSIHTELWPKYDPRVLEEDQVTIVVQINGKVRETILVPQGVGQKEIEQKAKESDRVKKYVEGKKIQKIVYVEGKIISFVVS